MVRVSFRMKVLSRIAAPGGDVERSRTRTIAEARSFDRRPPRPSDGPLARVLILSDAYARPHGAHRQGGLTPSRDALHARDPRDASQLAELRALVHRGPT